MLESYNQLIFRERAREMGHHKGALFPWRSILGKECSTFFPAGTAQYHINGDISLAVKNYVQSSGDKDFLLSHGGEILFETARLWTDLGHYNPRKEGRFCIDGVTGPDEYTAIVNNNFYTNRIARENLWYAHEVYQTMKAKYPKELQALAKKIALNPEEPSAWKKAGDAMYFPYDEEKKIALQDDSFLDKAPWDFENTPKDQYPLLLHFHPLVIYRHQVLKQADTVLADFLFDQYVDTEQIKRNFDFYEPLTTHDSSLSACIYSIIASRIGYDEKAYDYFIHSVRTDLDDHKGNTQDGVHIANMAGTTLALISGFGGVRQWDGKLVLNPVLPKPWDYYAFPIAFQGGRLRVKVTKGETVIVLEEGKPLTLTCYGQEVQLETGQPVFLKQPA